MAREFATGFYKSQAWKKCREAYAKKQRYLCEDCLANGVYKSGVIVHHVTELTPLNIEVPEVALGWGNLRLLCRECHAAAHDKRARDRRFFVGEDGKIVPIRPPDTEKK